MQLATLKTLKNDSIPSRVMVDQDQVVITLPVLELTNARWQSEKGATPNK